MHSRNDLGLHVARLRDALARYEGHHSAARRAALLRHAIAPARIVSRMLGIPDGDDGGAPPRTRQ